MPLFLFVFANLSTIQTQDQQTQDQQKAQNATFALTQ